MERLKYKHYLKRANTELEAKNYSRAREWYSRLLDEGGDCNDAFIALLGRSSAYVKCGRFKEGLCDADRALEYHPKSTKAHTRRAEALFELKRYYEAAESYSQAIKHDETAVEREKCIWRCLERMTADDISTRLCCIITQASTDALIAVPSIEQATKRELEDAAYKMVCDSLDRTPPFPKYRELLFQWLRVGLRSALLYAHRSRAFCYCKKYNQAHDDALSALEEIKNLEKSASQGMSQKELRHLKSLSSFALAESLLACQEHPRRDVCGALEWYKAAQKFDDSSQQIFADKIQQCTFSCFSTNSESLSNKTTQSFERSVANNECLIQVTLSITSVSNCGLRGSCRNVLRKRVAEMLDIPLHKVALESVRTSDPYGNKIQVVLHAEIRTQEDPVKQCKERLQSLTKPIEKDEDSESFGCLSVDQIELVENTAISKHEILSLSEDSKSQECEKEKQSSNNCDYDLVFSNGQRAPKKQRHAFGISKLLLHSSEVNEEIWAQMHDGSCRWRQSATEIKIHALKVPNKTPCVQLTVEITTKSISSKRIIDELSENLRCHTVSNTESGAEYLRGKLTKDILPEESYWTIDETDGCMLFLKKMNLEIINNELDVASKTWWNRLFEHHGQLQWDDYDKDLTDLPKHYLNHLMDTNNS